MKFTSKKQKTILSYLGLLKLHFIKHTVLIEKYQHSQDEVRGRQVVEPAWHIGVYERIRNEVVWEAYKTGSPGHSRANPIHPDKDSSKIATMKFTLLAMIALASGAISQVTTSEDPGPSPTASVGCEPHGDHW